MAGAAFGDQLLRGGQRIACGWKYRLAALTRRLEDAEVSGVGLRKRGDKRFDGCRDELRLLDR